MNGVVCRPLEGDGSEAQLILSSLPADYGGAI
jgi:hypothetical protein